MKEREQQLKPPFKILDDLIWFVSNGNNQLVIPMPSLSKEHIGTKWEQSFGSKDGMFETSLQVDTSDQFSAYVTSQTNLKSPILLGIGWEIHKQNDKKDRGLRFIPLKAGEENSFGINLLSRPQGFTNIDFYLPWTAWPATDLKGKVISTSLFLSIVAGSLSKHQIIEAWVNYVEVYHDLLPDEAKLAIQLGLSHLALSNI